MTAWFLRIFKRHSLLWKRLPKLRGVIREDEPLAKKNWFGVGGPAELYFEPADEADLSLFVQSYPDEPMTILGAGSNVLIKDGGIPGLTVHLGKAFSYIHIKGNKLVCGGGALLVDVAKVAEKNNISGFEFLSGIPGSIGGAVRMNAGAFGQSVSEIMTSVSAVMPNGKIAKLNPQKEELFEYRKCYMPTDWIFTEVTLKGKKVKNPEVIRSKMELYKQKREETQPKKVRTAGSSFKNPMGLSAGRLIEKAGLKGARVGDAVVSEKHANFIINVGNATAKDIEKLGEKIIHTVQKKQGITLEWEIKKIGVDKA